jgi:ZIP family zinc transporter
MSALAWGLLAGAALPLGAAAGVFLRLPRRVTAAILAFGSGTLIAAVSVVLMEAAWGDGGVAFTALAFFAGAAAYTGADTWLRRRRQASETQSGLSIAAGSALDNIPESIVIGASTLGGGVSAVLVAGVFFSNLPEGLASAERLRRGGWRAPSILALWCAIGLASALAAWAGQAAFGSLPGWTLAGANALAAGAIITMLADTLVPQAYAEAHDFAGMVTAAGFLLAFVLHKAGT